MAEHNISPKKRRLDIDRVHINLSQKELQRYILEIAKEPVVFLDKISDWKSLAWTPESLAKQHSNVRTRFRFCPRISSSEYCFAAEHAVMETDCHFVEGTLEDFYKWLTCDEANLQNSAFQKFPRKELTDYIALTWEYSERDSFIVLDRADYSCYADYKYMKDLFDEYPGNLEDMNWACLGFPTRTGEHSTFWMGSDESFTPCHYDSYGCNLVAQLYGKKKWLLFSPTQSRYLHPTRIPYEESSVFSQVNIQHPDYEKFPSFQQATCYEVILEPGDVLFVPKHWWHYVECMETAISVNTWIEMGTDNYDRIEEAITRALADIFLVGSTGVLVNNLARPGIQIMKVVAILMINPLQSQKTKVDASSQNVWLNPSMREENLSFHESMHYLRQALKLFHREQTTSNNGVEQQESTELSAKEFINTVASPDVVQIIAQKLIELTKPTR